MDKESLLREQEEPPSYHATVLPISPSRELIFPPTFPFQVDSPPPSFGQSGAQVPRLTVSDRSHEFRRRFFPKVPVREWNDWRWQNRNRVKTVAELGRFIRLAPDELDAGRRQRGSLPLGITPYYASLLDERDPYQPLRRTVVPSTGEFARTSGEADDPLGEDGNSPVSNLVHRYPDRVLFLVTNFCTTYCRYCTRSRMVGAAGERTVKRSQLEEAIDYIARTPSIRDVLISGGDPLSLGDDKLEWLLTSLRRIPHVEFLRIGTKIPAVMPQRITPALTRILKKFHPLWMSIHFLHPDEITPETGEACERLADAGIPLGSQTVLLKGVNDSVATMRDLVHGLLKIRVRPYYLYQCDPISGSAHFRTPVEKGIEIIQGLRGHTTGYAVPHFVVDAPGGGGKIPLLPDYVAGRDGDDLLLRNYEGKLYRYPDPGGRLGADRVAPAAGTVPAAVVAPAAGMAPVAVIGPAAG
ncbi:MAG: KamA family radical SAM protein [Candidatus Lambdaproteobacteria bacterium]|nr:KamA family radical SAM protein [Candidatus Lambdaproteobacteria bacterium]